MATRKVIPNLLTTVNVDRKYHCNAQFDVNPQNTKTTLYLSVYLSVSHDVCGPSGIVRQPHKTSSFEAKKVARFCEFTKRERRKVNPLEIGVLGGGGAGFPRKILGNFINFNHLEKPNSKPLQHASLLSWFPSEQYSTKMMLYKWQSCKKHDWLGSLHQRRKCGI